MNYRVVANIFLGCIFLNMLMCGILWRMGFVIAPCMFPVAVLLSTLYYLKNLGKWWRELLFSLLVLAMSIFLSAYVWDYSWDGQAYHQPMVYAMAKGWNPVWESHNPIIADKWNMNIWIDHYPKGMECVAASIYAMTGNLESGKAVNIIWMFSVWCLLLDFFMKCPLFGFSGRKSLLYATLTAYSVLFVQLGFTFYID